MRTMGTNVGSRFHVEEEDNRTGKLTPQLSKEMLEVVLRQE